MNLFNIGTFFFLSLGITFILSCLLVYHFKKRLDLYEQKNDTMFDIINNMLVEITNMKKQQNVLFMFINQIQMQLNNSNDISNVLKKDEPDERDEPDDDENEDEYENEDEQDKDEYDDEDERDEDERDKDDEEQKDENEDENEDSEKNIYADFTNSETTLKIKVSDDEYDDINYHQSQIISLLEENTKNKLLDIDLKILNIPKLRREYYINDIDDLDEKYNGNQNKYDINEDNEDKQNKQNKQNYDLSYENINSINHNYQDEHIINTKPNPENIDNNSVISIISILSEKSNILNKEKNAEKAKYRKINIQDLRTMVGNKYNDIDASKLKKKELIRLMIPDI